jgi:ABC-type molybdate transport system substrate-binding protein
LIAATEKSLPLRTEGRAVIARVGVGVIVREGAPRPDISTPDATRKLLLDARSVALPDPITPSGAHLERMVSQFGIANELRPKTIVKAAIHGGGELVAKGDAEVGIYLLSEVQSLKGIEVVGLLPAELQNFVVYGSAVPGYNESPELAAAFVKFATDPSKGAIWKAAGSNLQPDKPTSAACQEGQAGTAGIPARYPLQRQACTEERAFNAAAGPDRGNWGAHDSGYGVV